MRLYEMLDAKKDTYCRYCGAKIPDIHYQMLKFVKKSQKQELEGKR